MTMKNDFSRSRALPWVLAIAVVLCVITTVATMGIVWWMRSRGPLGTNAATASRPGSMANWSPAMFSSQAPDGVRKTSEKSWSVKGGRAFMNVRRKDDETLEVRFVYPFDFLSPETTTLVQTRWNLREVEKQADALAITPEQIASLKAVSPATDMPVSTPDKERLRSMFEDYLSAKNAAGEKALVEAVAELDANYYDRTIQRIDGIAEKVKSILSPEQLAALSEIRNRPRPAKTVKPAR
jgi:hypothetical protein